VLFKDGVVMMVELDNTITHREAPHEAYARDAVLKDEGVLVERIETPRNANEARNAVNYIVGKIKKAKANR
jgi:very-short-patch-repair endonuclease